MRLSYVCFVCIVITFLTFQSLANDHLFQEQGKEAITVISKQQDLAKYMFTISTIEGQPGIDTPAPMLLIYHDCFHLLSDITLTPVLYLALWQDGTIIWSKTEGQNIRSVHDYLWGDMIDKIEYYQSKISDKEIEQFLSSVDKIDILKFSKIEFLRSPGPSRNCCFYIEINDIKHKLSFSNIDWPNSPFDELPRQYWSQEKTELAEKWQLVHKLILDLIPQNEIRINLSIKSRKQPHYDWCVSPSYVLSW